MNNVSIKTFPRTEKGVDLGIWYRPMLKFFSQTDPTNKEIQSTLDHCLSMSSLWCIAVANSYLQVGYASLEGGLLAYAHVADYYRRRGVYKDLVRVRMEYAKNVLKVNEISVEPTDVTEEYFRKLGFEIKTDEYEQTLGILKVR